MNALDDFLVKIQWNGPNGDIYLTCRSCTERIAVLLNIRGPIEVTGNNLTIPAEGHECQA